MGGKRSHIAVGARLSLEDKARIDAAARAAGLSTAAYLKRCALHGSGVVVDDRTADRSATRSAAAVESYHVDVLGPDTLRVDTGALAR
jgi:hypothetical protein